MSAPTYWETIKVEGGQLLDKVKQILREGNVRRIVITQGDRTVAEFPLTVGVVSAVFAPVLAAVGAIAALLTDCSISIERERPSTTTTASDAPADAEAPPSNVHPFTPPTPPPPAPEPPSAEPPSGL